MARRQRQAESQARRLSSSGSRRWRSCPDRSHRCCRCRSSTRDPAVDVSLRRYAARALRGLILRRPHFAHATVSHRLQPPCPAASPKHFIDELIARADIVELIGSRVPLKKARQGIQGLLPVPRRENPVVHGVPGQAVLSLLRLRRARHGARFPDGARSPELRRSRRGAGRARRARRAARGAARRAPRPPPTDGLFAAAGQGGRALSRAS